MGLNFQNGLMLFNGNIYDKSGKVTTPESLGVTSFIKWDGTYLLAEKITSDYASTKKELGVLNKTLEWVLPLAEAHDTIYAESEDAFYNLLILSEAERNARISMTYIQASKSFSAQAR